MRVAVGAVAKRLLEEFGIEVIEPCADHRRRLCQGAEGVAPGDQEAGRGLGTALRRPRSGEADDAQDRRGAGAGDSLGGVFEVIVTGVPVGLGSHVHWDRKLDGKLAAALMSIQAIKGVEVGSGFGVANKPGLAGA